MGSNNNDIDKRLSKHVKNVIDTFINNIERELRCPHVDKVINDYVLIYGHGAYLCLDRRDNKYKTLPKCMWDEWLNAREDKRYIG